MAIVVDGCHHMKGRLASTVANELMNGRDVLVVRCEEICISGGDLRKLENKRKERSQAVYERKKQLTTVRIKAEKVAEEKLGAELEILAPVTY